MLQSITSLPSLHLYLFFHGLKRIFQADISLEIKAYIAKYKALFGYKVYTIHFFAGVSCVYILGQQCFTLLFNEENLQKVYLISILVLN